jgi:hypothetical protein
VALGRQLDDAGWRSTDALLEVLANGGRVRASWRAPLEDLHLWPACETVQRLAAARRAALAAAPHVAEREAQQQNAAWVIAFTEQRRQQQADGTLRIPTRVQLEAMLLEPAPETQPLACVVGQALDELDLFGEFEAWVIQQHPGADWWPGLDEDAAASRV